MLHEVAEEIRRSFDIVISMFKDIALIVFPFLLLIGLILLFVKWSKEL